MYEGSRSGTHPDLEFLEEDLPEPLSPPSSNQEVKSPVVPAQTQRSRLKCSVVRKHSMEPPEQNIDDELSCWRRKVSKPFRASLRNPLAKYLDDILDSRVEEDKPAESELKMQNLMNTNSPPSKLLLISLANTQSPRKSSLYELKIIETQKKTRRFSESRQNFLQTQSKSGNSVGEKVGEVGGPDEDRGSPNLNSLKRGTTPLLLCRSVSVSGLKQFGSGLGDSSPLLPQNNTEEASSPTLRINRPPLAQRFAGLAAGQFWAREIRKVTEELRGSSIGHHSRTSGTIQIERNHKRKMSDRKVLHDVVKDFYKTNSTMTQISESGAKFRTRSMSQVYDQNLKPEQLDMISTQQNYTDLSCRSPAINLPSPVLERIRKDPKHLRNPLRISGFQKGVVLDKRRLFNFPTLASAGPTAQETEPSSSISAPKPISVVRKSTSHRN